MILVDTSVWIDHLHTVERRLVERLELDAVGCHPLVIEELALGSIAGRDIVLDLLGNLTQFPTAQHAEIRHFVERRQLWGRGLSAVDVHLMAAVVMVEGAKLWTRDKRLKAASSDAGVPLFGE
ncbi:type II toxin-antitoxin system VapC family toxin [Mycobacterium bourgelatii]|uniref:Ribonuclease VapC n=1 Tax=Mycobacterium bourgelatii TaxID=1273442 RepID=A0A7I9YV02_MYCBU|nr:type II toxin-antitoxin system VapC family toxin [Mycobacterium bourgelatii]MCV6974799.1 type II toxin-antitoxin system VapC family toxin [Mycobacterium bourgelatii]GFG92412.1 ribonuclease VapC32 [Mycobacterium bourgelatii]